MCSCACDSVGFSMPGTPGIASIFMVQSQSPTNCFSISCSLVFGSGICDAPPAFSWANNGNAATKRAADRTVVFFCMSGLLEQGTGRYGASANGSLYHARRPARDPGDVARHGTVEKRCKPESERQSFGEPAFGVLTSPEPAFDVIGRLAFLRRDEHLLGRAVLDDAAEQHEHALVAGAARLRHVVRDDQDRVAAAQVPDQVLDGGRRLGIERRARLVR